MSGILRRYPRRRQAESLNGRQDRAYLRCEMVTELLPNALRSIFTRCRRSARAATQSPLCVDG
jgi:hypothetical protein